MGLWETIRGERRQRPANLDALFFVPSAAITLETAAGIRPTGAGSVCFRAAEGAAFDQAQDEVVALINANPDAPDVSLSRDSFGFSWLVATRDPSDMGGLCTDLHAVNTILQDQGFGSGLLCSMVTFRDAADRSIGLVYLYKQGTFYPFVPTGDGAGGTSQTRDNLTEVMVRELLAPELPMEPQLSRWMALWGAPGL
ncbi:MAG: hypothetical protein WAW88_15750 [Nocardioides sp.]